jgi:hypothetical protein
LGGLSSRSSSRPAVAKATIMREQPQQQRSGECKHSGTSCILVDSCSFQHECQYSNVT